MIIGRQQDVTVAATSVMERTSDPRLRESLPAALGINRCHALVDQEELGGAKMHTTVSGVAHQGQAVGVVELGLGEKDIAANEEFFRPGDEAEASRTMAGHSPTTS